MSADKPRNRMKTLRYGTVVSREPIYEDVRQHAEGEPQRNRPIGFDVIYEFGGERYEVRVQKNPGTRIALNEDLFPFDAESDRSSRHLR